MAGAPTRASRVWPPSVSSTRWAGALVRHVHEGGLGERRHGRDGQVLRRPLPRRADGHGPRVGRAEDVRQRALHRGVRRQHVGRFRDQHDGHEVPRHVVACRRAQHGIDHQLRVAGHQQGVAVGRGLGDGLCADHAAATGLVVDDQRLAQAFAHGLRHDARVRIQPAAGRVRHHNADRLGRVGRRIGVCRQRAGTGQGGQRTGAPQLGEEVHRASPWRRGGAGCFGGAVAQ